LKYKGKTGRKSAIKNKEHIHAVRNNNGNSGYLNYKLNSGLTYGTIIDAITFIKPLGKGI
jgi:hypothetical protein